MRKKATFCADQDWRNMWLLLVYHTEYLCDTSTPEPRRPTEQQARYFTLGRSSISHSSWTSRIHVSHFFRVENPKFSRSSGIVLCGHKLYFRTDCNHPPNNACGGLSRRLSILHLGVKKEILYLGIKNDDRMKVALDGCSSQIFSVSP